MAHEIPDSEPSSLRAGTTWTWRRSFADYPASEFTLAYAIRGVHVLTWSTAYVAVDGAGWLIEIPATATTGIAAGAYEWAAYVTAISGGDKYVAAEGALTVLPDLEAAAAAARQPHAERMVTLIQAELERRLTTAASGGQAAIEAYSVDQRNVQRLSTPELRKLLGQYQAELQRAKHPFSFGRRVLQRFVPISPGPG